MAKMVSYNGGNLSYYSCSDPKNLVIGKVYEVISENDRGWQTDYTLKGVDGAYNSVWFDEVKAYMGFSRNMPIVGHKYNLFRVEIEGGKPKLEPVTTSSVKTISPLGNNIFCINTQNSVYYVEIVF